MAEKSEVSVTLAGQERNSQSAGSWEVTNFKNKTTFPIHGFEDSRVASPRFSGWSVASKRARTTVRDGRVSWMCCPCQGYGSTLKMSFTGCVALLRGCVSSGARGQTAHVCLWGWCACLRSALTQNDIDERRRRSMRGYARRAVLVCKHWVKGMCKKG